MTGASIRIAILANAARARAELNDLGDNAARVGDRVRSSLGGLGDSARAGLAGLGLAAGASLAAGITGALAQADLTARLGVQLGLAGPEAARYGQMAGTLYASGFGTDATQVGQAIKGVYQNIGKGNAQWTKEITSQVLTVANTFEQDLGGTTAAVGQLMKTGMAKDATEALDIITRGLATGANKSEDLLETFTEYGTQFRKLGIDGKTATGLLTQGLRAGARDADTVADAIKEFSIRAIDGSKATGLGFRALGLDSKRMADDIAAGGPRANTALDTTLDRLRAIKDPVARSAAAVQLFGTKAEDLGAALFALDPSEAAAELGQVAGAAKAAADAMGETPAARIEAFKRSLTQGFANAAGGLAGFAVANAAWLVPLVGTLAAVGAAIWVVNAATKAWAAAQAAIVVITGVWRWAQLTLNASFLANPIFLIILAVAAFIAVIVLAYKRSETFRAIVQAVWGAIKTAVSAVVSWFTANIPKLWATARQVFVNILAVAAGAWAGIRNVIANAINGAKSAVVSAVSGIKALFSPSTLYSAGTQMIQGLISGVKAMAGRAVSAVREVVGNAVSGAKRLLGIASPSKVFARIGEQTGQGFVLGLDRQRLAARRAAEQLLDIPSAVPMGQTPIDVTQAPGGSTRPTVAIHFDGGGDPLMDAVWEQLRKRVRVAGGSVQLALGKG